MATNYPTVWLDPNTSREFIAAVGQHLSARISPYALDGTLIATSDPDAQAAIGQQQTIQGIDQVIAVLAAGLAVGLAGGWLLALDLERPLRRSPQAISSMAQGGPLVKLPEQGPREIRVLVRAFNTLTKLTALAGRLAPGSPGKGTRLAHRYA